MGRTEALRIPAGQWLGQLDVGPSTQCIEGLHARPGHGHAHTQADGLGKSLFGCKTGSEKPNTAAGITLVASMKGLNFVGAKYPAHKPLGMAIEHQLYAIQLQ